MTSLILESSTLKNIIGDDLIKLIYGNHEAKKWPYWPVPSSNARWEQVGTKKSVKDILVSNPYKNSEFFVLVKNPDGSYFTLSKASYSSSYKNVEEFRVHEITKAKKYGRSWNVKTLNKALELIPLLKDPNNPKAGSGFFVTKDTEKLGRNKEPEYFAYTDAREYAEKIYYQTIKIFDDRCTKMDRDLLAKVSKTLSSTSPGRANINSSVSGSIEALRRIDLGWVGKDKENPMANRVYGDISKSLMEAIVFELEKDKNAPDMKTMNEAGTKAIKKALEVYQDYLDGGEKWKSVWYR